MQSDLSALYHSERSAGQRPAALAHVLGLRRFNIIGGSADEIGASCHAKQIIQDAQNATSASGKMLLVINTNHNTAFEQAVREMREEEYDDDKQGTEPFSLWRHRGGWHQMGLRRRNWLG